MLFQLNVVSLEQVEGKWSWMQLRGPESSMKDEATPYFFFRERNGYTSTPGNLLLTSLHFNAPIL